MKDVFRGMLLLATVLAASIANAGWQAQPVTITGYYVWDGGNAYIKTTNHTNSEGCQSNVYIALDSTSRTFSAIWAQVITAHTTGSTVTVHLSGCMGPYPKAIAIAVPSVW